jgi:hypothetical protein
MADIGTAQRRLQPAVVRRTGIGDLNVTHGQAGFAVRARVHLEDLDHGEQVTEAQDQQDHAVEHLEVARQFGEERMVIDRVVGVHGDGSPKNESAPQILAAISNSLSVSAGFQRNPADTD